MLSALCFFSCVPVKPARNNSALFSTDHELIARLPLKKEHKIINFSSISFLAIAVEKHKNITTFLLSSELQLNKQSH